MAIKKNIELDSGLAITDSYARVDNRSGSNKGDLTFALNYYISQQAAEEGKAFVKQEFYTFQSSVESESPNDIKQCYQHLKTLPDFEEAIDC